MNYNNDSYIELVKKAQLGEEECMNRLSGLASQGLRVYISRLTLHKDLTEDIVQETMLEMVRLLNKLEKPDRFWPWLRKIAVHKMYSQNKRQNSHRIVSRPDDCREKQDNYNGLVSLISEELKQTVAAAMAKIKSRHRQVLTLRCYEDLSYSEIADEMGCSEFAARVLFFRAKKLFSRV